MVHGLVIALVGPIRLNATRLVDFTWKALLVFKMDVGVLVDMLADSDESDDPAVAMVCGGDFSLNLDLKACSLSAFGWTVICDCCLTHPRGHPSNTFSWAAMADVVLWIFQTSD